MASIVRVSNFLQGRHPYKDKSFREKMEDDKNSTLTGYGLGAIERYITKLQDPSFPDDSKLTTIKALLTMSKNEEWKARAVQFGLVAACRSILEAPREEVMLSNTCKLLSLVADLPSGAASFDREGVFAYVLDLVRRPSGDEASLERREEAAMVLRVLADSLQGVSQLLTRDDCTCIPSLVTVISEADLAPTVYVIVCTILRRLTETPEGRAQALAAGILGVLQERMIAQAQLETEYLSSSEAALESIRMTFSVVWNMLLEQPSKIEATKREGFVASAALLLHKSNQIPDLQCQRYGSGALAALFIYEPAKSTVLVAVPDPTDADLDLAGVLVETLHQLLQHASFTLPMLTAEQQEELNVARQQAEDNVVEALRLASENPASRRRIAKCSCPYASVFTRIFKGTTLFNPYSSSSMDLLPEFCDGTLLL